MKSENIADLASALCKAQSQIKNATKDSTNPFFKSKYADLTSTWEACREALNTNGLSVIQTLNGDNLETTLIHTSGEWISGSCPLIHRGDMQSLGSAISYSRRYSLAAIVGVTSDDDDAESAGKSGDIKSPRSDSSEPCTTKQAGMISAKLKAAGIVGLEMQKFLATWGTHLPERIPFIKVNEVLEAIQKHKPIKDPSEPPAIEDVPFDPSLRWGK
jgi:hypothetical protein